MLLAAFSDIHGNIHALNAVLSDIAARGTDGVVCLGDLVGYGAFPNEVIERIRAQGIPTILGNYDDGAGFDKEECGCAYTDPADIERGDRSLRWTQQTLTAENKAWLRSLPRELRFEMEGRRVLCVHGSPRRINEYLYEDRPERSLVRMFEGMAADVVLCGHTHLAYHRRIAEVHLVNTGSVGRPRDGDPRAGYALLSLGADLTVTFPRVPYDAERAAQGIEASGLPAEFAQALRVGRY